MQTQEETQVGEVEPNTLIHGDCLKVMSRLEAGSVDLILTDPPYFKVKNEAWDRQWDKPAVFLEWMGGVLNEFYRILKPNGSLYIFASPQMSARVECKVAETFNVLNHIVWNKPSGRHLCAEKKGLRGFFPQTERIIFAEHYGADNMAKGEAGYQAKCDELRGFIFEPLRSYLDGERIAALLSFEDVRNAVGCADGSGLPSHWFTSSQWCLPTEANYMKLRQATGHFCRSYESLRQEYESLRRPFAVSADVHYTDVWTFKTVSAYPGKHPCEKPQPLLRHIIEASSNSGALVFDAFMGSGATGVACINTGRNFIGIEQDAEYFKMGERRINETQKPLMIGSK